MDSADRYSLYTDGGSRSNPGIAAIGGVIFNGDKDEVSRFKQFIGVTTNNVAEYTALFNGMLEALNVGARYLDCFLDSELVVKQLNGEYKVREHSLSLLKDRVEKLSKKFEDVAFYHIPREENKIADRLVNEAFQI